MKKIIILMAIIITFIGFISINVKKANQLKEYARINNCTWRDNGTMYGDNRDFTCIKNEVAE